MRLGTRQQGQFAALVLSIFCVFMLENTAAQTTATAIFSKKTVETGDTFNLRILVAGSPIMPQTVDLSRWKTFLPTENILHQSAWTASGKNWAKDFTLILFDSADLKLPPLTVRLRSTDSVKTNPLELRIFPAPASGDLSDMDDIRDIRRAPANWQDHWKWILTGLVLAIFGVFFYRKKPKMQPGAPSQVVEKQVSLLDLTMQKLDGLERRTAKKPKTSPTFSDEFCTELSLIVRQFLEKKYGIKALESTTKEILAFLKTTHFPENQAAALRELLQQTDFSKFSEMPAPPGFVEKSLRNARNLVSQTAQ